MTVEADIDEGRERRCIVTGEILSDAALVRFVADPEGVVVPDVGGTLPGRGLWVRAERGAVERAVERNAFSRAAKESLSATSDLAERTERLIAQRMLSDLGLARRAGQLVLGYDNVARGFEGTSPPVVLVQASDGSSDGLRKLMSIAQKRGLDPQVLDCFTAQELSLALGRENVVHAAIKSGRLAERLMVDAGRLSGFRHAAQGNTSAKTAELRRHEREE